MAYDINTTWEPLSEGPFHAAIKALRLETNDTKGPNPHQKLRISQSAYFR